MLNGELGYYVKALEIHLLWQKSSTLVRGFLFWTISRRLLADYGIMGEIIKLQRYGNILEHDRLDWIADREIISLLSNPVKGLDFFMEYERFGITRAETIIVSKFVEMTWTANNKKRYENLGYKYTKQLDKFACHVEDVSPGSGVMIEVECPVCAERRFVEYKHLTRFGHTLCNGCAHVVDLTGARFDRWTVISFAGSKNGNAYWWCRCECGEERSVQYSGLSSGSSRSCGCYNVDMSKERSGENSPTWKGGPITAICEICGVNYQVKRSHAAKSKTCSRKCAGILVSRTMSGTNSPHWNFSLTTEERIVGRKFPEYTKWVKDILRRDQYICQVCGSTENVEAHHLHSYRHYPELALSLKNGITLCKKDHRAFHLWMGGNSVECVPSDLDRWLYETQ